MHKMKFLIKPIFAVFIGLATLTAQAQISTRPTPMWEGYEKTAADIQSDNKFVKETIELAGGDAAKAAVSLVEIGWQRIGEGDPNHAIRAFNQAWLIVTRWFNRTRQLIALKGLPENHRLEADEARVLAERGEHGKAKPLFKKALSIDPNYIPAHIGMMNIADALGDAELKQKHQTLHDELVK